MDAQKRLQIKVFTPYQTFFQGSALSLSARNRTGKFDVLYDHSSFFSTLEPGRVVVNTGFEKLQIEIDSGVLHVRNNKVVLFANVS